MDKKELFSLVDRQQDRLLELACQIFDRPEWDGQEHFAAQLLSGELEKAGFQVERGIGGMETAFRATWSNGEGGVNIGILGEYDALKDMGHVCGHHMQTPAAIGAAVAVKSLLQGTDIPFTLTVYGTPAEESFGGKIKMEQNGCFRELDVALATHASRTQAGVGGSSMALKYYHVTFKGIAAHASGAPHMGRSAADAMYLSFNGMEFLREHVMDGTRLTYWVRPPLPSSGVVPPLSCAGYSLRYPETAYLEELEQRFRNIIQGACMMTDTQAEIEPRSGYAANKKNTVLAQVARENLQLLQIPTQEDLYRNSKGATDFGNVAHTVPGALVYIPYYDAPTHSQQWADQGKSQHALRCLMHSARLLAGMAYDIIQDPAIAAAAKKEFNGQ